MPAPALRTPSPSAVPVMRHKNYFFHEADVNFRVEGYVFRVHRYFFLRESAHFRELLGSSAFPGQDAPGMTEANPVVLHDATSDGFACFLWVFYNPKYSIYNATPKQWSMILELAQQWGFKEVELLCIRELERLDMSPVDRIYIYQERGIDHTLLLDSYATLTTRDEPIALEEGIKLGIKTSLQIARAREMSRGPDTGTGLRSPSAVQVLGPDLHTLIQGIFELPPLRTGGVAHAGPYTAPIHPSHGIDRASALPSVPTAPTTPSKPEALSQSNSSSSDNPPSYDGPVDVKGTSRFETLKTSGAARGRGRGGTR
ncbi:hypothetical protein BC834DRAFT_486177 [Gloeopeniophorella convolvens]|nr:hypothetical protein BC834DRAFT_486177 [Gloeopeniophorella convolvens]